MTIKAWRRWKIFCAFGLVGGAVLLAACGGQTSNQSGSGRDSRAQQDAGGGAAPIADNALPQPNVQDRKIVRNANLDLRVDSVTTAVQQIDDVATGAGGFVSASNVFVNTDDAGDRAARTQTAAVTIRVPTEAYPTVMGRLRGIAKETVSETSTASEVTEEFTDLQARLRNLQATEQRYLDLLSKAVSIDDILTVQDRLNGVRLEIEQVTGKINVLNNQTDFASITVKLSPLPAAAQAEGQNWAQKAWNTSWETSKNAMVVLGTIAIVSGVLLAWLAIPATICLVAWRLFGRRLADFVRRLEGGRPTAVKTD